MSAPPRGLLDALSRYFTPSDKRRSRVSLNSLPHASPKALVAVDSRSPTSVADTTHDDDSLPPTLLPVKRRRCRSRQMSSSESARRSSLCSEAVLQADNCVDGVQTASWDSPTSELSPSRCTPSQPKPEDAKLETTTNEGSADGERRLDTVVAVKVETEKQSVDVRKPRRPRQTQLSSLQDSLSHFFLADGDRRRTPAHYTESAFLFDTYQHFNSEAKSAKRQQSKCASRATGRVDVVEPAASWPVTCNQLSNYHLSGEVKCELYGYSSSQSNLPHRCGNSHAIRDHTVLPATRQR